MHAELGADGIEITVVTSDITNQSDVDKLVSRVGDRIDIVANVAGIMDHFVPLDELDDDAWNRIIDVNLTGAMRVSRAMLPLMRAAGSGAFVNVASKASISGGASGVSYAASNHGLLGLTRHVAYFYGPDGIRCNAVLAGGVAMGITATAAPRSDWAMQRAMAPMGAIGRTAEADEIAAAMSWLACAEASNVNGAVLSADGGWSAA